MAGPTTAQRALLAEIEGRATDLNRLLDAYEAGLENARRERNRRLIRWLNNEIAYTVAQLAEVKARRDALRQALQDPAR